MIRSFCKEELRKGRIMNIKKFTDMLLNSLEKMEVSATKVEQITEDGAMLGIATSDDSQFFNQSRQAWHGTGKILLGNGRNKQ